MLKVGIIGCGKVTERMHLPGYAKCPNVKVVAAADTVKKRAREMAEKFSIPHTFTDYKEMLKEVELDAVSVCTPNYLHAQMTMDSCRAGKNVLVEKPMATSMREAQRMIDAAKRNKVILMVEQPRRFSPVTQVSKEILDSGLLGKIRGVRGRQAHSGPEHWAPGSRWFFKKDEAFAGSLADLGIHILDALLFLTGKRVTQVAGFTSTIEKKRSQVEDNAVFIIRFADGSLGEVSAAWTQSPLEASYTIYCEKGWLESSGRKVTVHMNTPRGTFEPEIPKRSKFGSPWQYFADCIEKGEKPFIDGEEGARSLEVILAAYQSAEEGCVVSLPLPRR